MEAREAVRRIRELSFPMEPRSTGAAPCLHPLPGIRAVVFDVYGTLFVSASGDVGTHAAGARGQALDSALNVCALDPAAGAGDRAAELLLQILGAAHDRSRAQGIEFPEVEIRDIFRQLLEVLADEALIRKMRPPAYPIGAGTELVERLALEYECRINPTWPMPGVVAMLGALRDGGRVLGVVSNAQFYTPWLFPAHLGVDLGELGLEEPLCAWSYRVGRAKPSTALFTPVLGHLAERGIEAPEVLYVGNDRRNDVLPAVRVGCRTVLFAGDRRSFRSRDADPRLAGVRPDAVITELQQLPGLLPARHA